MDEIVPEWVEKRLGEGGNGWEWASSVLTQCEHQLSDKGVGRGGERCIHPFVLALVTTRKNREKTLDMESDEKVEGGKKWETLARTTNDDLRREDLRGFFPVVQRSKLGALFFTRAHNVHPHPHFHVQAFRSNLSR
jgi:hypothetical protein